MNNPDMYLIFLFVIIFTLVVGNVFQFVFWSSQVNKLLNKLMSRNYAEYVTSDKFVPEPAGIKVNLDDSLNEEKDILNELNGMLKA